MSAAWPSVVARLVELFTEAAPLGASVYDGPPVTSEATTLYVTVGHVEDEVGGSFEVETIYDGAQLIERGTVVNRIVSQSGDDDLAEHRARAFAIAEDFLTAVRTDRTLGVLSADATTSTATDVSSIRNSQGSACALTLTVTYTTRY